MSHIGNSLSETSVLTDEYCGPDRAFKNIIYIYLSLVIICLYPKECDQLISKKSMVIGIMCKLSPPTQVMINECNYFFVLA